MNDHDYICIFRRNCVPTMSQCETTTLVLSNITGTLSGTLGTLYCPFENAILLFPQGKIIHVALKNAF